MRLLVTLSAAAFLIWAASGSFEMRELRRLERAAHAFHEHWQGPAPLASKPERLKRPQATTPERFGPPRGSSGPAVVAAEVQETLRERALLREPPAEVRVAQEFAPHLASEAQPSRIELLEPHGPGLVREQAERIHARLDRVLSLAAGVRE